MGKTICTILIREAQPSSKSHSAPTKVGQVGPLLVFRNIKNVAPPSFFEMASMSLYIPTRKAQRSNTTKW